ncbi:MAG: neutral/alkaline non-lysosomal ceramidase N-terminal domain-containing protein [Pirellula sp.]
MSMLKTVLLSILLGLSMVSTLCAQNWRAGAAAKIITPTKYLWMAGYGSRDKPADGKTTELYAKALVLESDNKTRVAIISLDLVGIDRELAMEVRQAIETKYAIPSNRVMLCCSHTHSGPVVRRNLGPLHYYKIDVNQRRLVEEYAVELRDTIVNLVGQAIDKFEPSKVSWGVGATNFAVNRRNNKEADVAKLRTRSELVGPSDHDVPVLAVHNDKGKLTSILFGYACHATVVSNYQWSADYPGYAQTELESRHPGCIAHFFAGCGADQNPLPRRTVELAAHYGRQLASAVDQVLMTSEMKQASPKLDCEYREVELAYDKLPTQDELKKQTESSNIYESLRAKQLLQEIENGKPLQPTYPYPVSFWRIGDELNMVALGGEVVVDYSLRIKSRVPRTSFVAGYSHDVMAYIPSYRVLKEGGYEGGGAMVYYGLPSIWSDGVEDTILDEVSRQAKALEAAPSSASMFEKNAKLQVVSEQGRGGEGPAWDPEWGVLTSGNGNINRLTRNGAAAIFREAAGTNGLLMDRDGSLLACEPVQKRVTRTLRDGTIKVLTASYADKPYNSPNDITLDSKGRIYFSDPRYGNQDGMQQLDSDGKKVEGVYRIDLDGKVSRVIGREVERANGVLVSADDRFLYVADNCNDRLGGARKLWRFDLQSDGSVLPTSQRMIYDWGTSRGPDGLKQDVLGNLYVAGGTSQSKPPFEPDASKKGGIYVFNAEGKMVEFVHVPTDEVTNCAFGGDDLRTLYITGGGTLYSIRTVHAGKVTWPKAASKP